MFRSGVIVVCLAAACSSSGGGDDDSGWTLPAPAGAQEVGALAKGEYVERVYFHPYRDDLALVVARRPEEVAFKYYVADLVQHALTRTCDASADIIRLSNGRGLWDSIGTKLVFAAFDRAYVCDGTTRTTDSVLPQRLNGPTLSHVLVDETGWSYLWFDKAAGYVATNEFPEHYNWWTGEITVDTQSPDIYQVITRSSHDGWLAYVNAPGGSSSDGFYNIHKQAGGRTLVEAHHFDSISVWPVSESLVLGLDSAHPGGYLYEINGAGLTPLTGTPNGSAGGVYRRLNASKTGIVVGDPDGNGPEGNGYVDIATKQWFHQDGDRWDEVGRRCTTTTTATEYIVTCWTAADAYGPPASETHIPLTSTGPQLEDPPLLRRTGDGGCYAYGHHRLGLDALASDWWPYFPQQPKPDGWEAVSAGTEGYYRDTDGFVMSVPCGTSGEARDVLRGFDTRTHLLPADVTLSLNPDAATFGPTRDRELVIAYHGVKEEHSEQRFSDYVNGTPPSVQWVQPLAAGFFIDGNALTPVFDRAIAGEVRNDGAALVQADDFKIVFTP